MDGVGRGGEGGGLVGEKRREILVLVAGLVVGGWNGVEGGRRVEGEGGKRT